jgi:putative transposase
MRVHELVSLSAVSPLAFQTGDYNAPRIIDSNDISIILCYTFLMKYELKTNNNIAYICHYHVVFCPKYRREVLVSPIDERLKTIILETIEKWGQECIEMEVMPDHVHLLVGCDPQFGIHRLVRYIKGTSSHYLRQEFPQLKRRLPSLWTNNYFVATVGGVTLETLKRYVEGQRGK